MSKETYKLRDGAASFYDDESGLKMVAGDTAEIDPDKATGLTATALLSGGLVKVNVSKGKSDDDKAKK
ncbi:MAG: hypothetical protein KIS76_03860 [Pyrinomonadaceae bacterium]|nr:hypothetical protein [Pyrinomonadaceae bacterium]